MQVRDFELNQQNLKAIIDAVPGVLLVTDVGGMIWAVNDRVTAATGYDRDQLLGKNVESLVPGISRTSTDLNCLMNNGGMFPVEVSFNPIQTPKGTFSVCILTDISSHRRHERELRRQAEELARSNKELEQFAYIASHDLQEPLRIVSGYCQLLKRRYSGKLDADADKFINYALEGAVRLQELITDLLAYSRVSTKAKPFAAVKLSEVAEQAVANLQMAINDRGAELFIDSLPEVMGDSHQLLQLFQNLIGNAVKFCSETNPKVWVKAARDKNFWTVTVKDNGIGIDPKHFEKIFTIFQRLHSREKYDGTGIGLAICKKVVQRHGGSIHVESEPGRGAEFIFTLPAMES